MTSPTDKREATCENCQRTEAVRAIFKRVGHEKYLPPRPIYLTNPTTHCLNCGSRLNTPADQTRGDG